MRSITKYIASRKKWAHGSEIYFLHVPLHQTECFTSSKFELLWKQGRRSDSDLGSPATFALHACIRLIQTRFATS